MGTHFIDFNLANTSAHHGTIEVFTKIKSIKWTPMLYSCLTNNVYNMTLQHASSLELSLSTALLFCILLSSWARKIGPSIVFWLSAQ